MTEGRRGTWRPSVIGAGVTSVSMFLVRLCVLPITRRTSIASGYRPDWVSDRKPEYNCARLTFPGGPIPPGGTLYGALLEPFRADQWLAVKVGDILEAREGRKTTATATVLQDVHWPAGMFGYFPSYLLGVAFAAQLWTRCQIEGAHGSSQAILGFLRRTVHQYGGWYTFEGLTDQMGGFDPTFYLGYLKRAYLL